MNLLAPKTVLVTSEDLYQMRRVWPCSGIPTTDVCVSFEFDSNGLCDISWYDSDGVDIEQPTGIDETCLLALSQDAQQFFMTTESESV